MNDTPSSRPYHVARSRYPFLALKFRALLTRRERYVERFVATTAGWAGKITPEANQAVLLARVAQYLTQIVSDAQVLPMSKK